MKILKQKVLIFKKMSSIECFRSKKYYIPNNSTLLGFVLLLIVFLKYMGWEEGALIYWI